MVQPPQANNHGKNDNNGKGWWFRFDADNMMSYKYIFSIIETLMGNTYKPTYCEENKEGNREN